MPDTIKQFLDAKEKLIIELSSLEAQIMQLTSRQVEIQNALSQELAVADPAPVAVKEERKNHLIHLKDPNDPNVMRLVRFLYMNPGATREDINARFASALELNDVKNLIAKCSKRKIIVNKGSRGAPEWHISE